ncbi:MAG TPA: M28 family peptidase, partial [Methanomassiliicoccales archaeon]|nr:M28 family peptidase [Methanomassiliicoccales archaeon]
ARDGVAARVSIESVQSVGKLWNVVATLPGIQEPSKTVMVTGHYDSVLTNGFVDNAGGVAAMLAIAEVMSDAVANHGYAPRYTTTFVAFTGEELGYVGSLGYIRMHQSNLGNIVAMLNFDCIGAQTMVISETEPSGGLDLDVVLQTAASDLDVVVVSEPPEGSDQYAFIDPSAASWTYLNSWDSDPGVGTWGVPECCMIASAPTSYQGMWTGGAYGTIHTDRDSKESALGTGWVSATNLAEQTQVGLLGVVRLNAVDNAIPEPQTDLALMLGAFVAVAAAAMFVVSWVLYRRTRREG